MRITSINTDLILNFLKGKSADKISLFGSYARGEENESSDVDILVNFKNKISLLDLIEIEYELSDILNKKVDLVTENSLRNKQVLKYISADLISLYNEKR